MSSSLESQSSSRKERLAQLRNLKSKTQNKPNGQSPDERYEKPLPLHLLIPYINTCFNSTSTATPPHVVISGRNFDMETRGPKLGFNAPPTSFELSGEDGAVETVELASQQLEEKALADLKAKSGRQIDLDSLQPKRANWDLKRDLEPKFQLLEDRTHDAVLQIVRERLQKERLQLQQQQEKQQEQE